FFNPLATPFAAAPLLVGLRSFFLGMTQPWKIVGLHCDMIRAQEAAMKTRHLDRELAQELGESRTVTANQTATLLDRREAERVPLHVHVFYASEEKECRFTGEGRLRNLSKKGCRIEGSSPVVAGSTVRILLDMDDGKGPLCLSGAMIVWNDGP